MTNSDDNLTSGKNKIAVVGSPSNTTEILLDIVQEGIDKKIVGQLTFLEFEQEKQKHVALGQIAEIELQNFMLEFPEMKTITKQRGFVNTITETQDTYKGNMTIGAIFSEAKKDYEPSFLGSVPSTGTSVYLADNDVLAKLLKGYPRTISYVGNFY